MKNNKTKKHNNQNYRRAVKQVLDRVRQKYHIGGKFTTGDFYRICEGENIELLNNEFGKALHNVKPLYGMFFTFRDGKKLVYLRSFFNRNHRLCMKSAMHELGHYFLGHKGFTAKMVADGNLSNPQDEKEANLFARLATKAEEK